VNDLPAITSDTLRDLQRLVGSDRPATCVIDGVTIEFVPAASPAPHLKSTLESAFRSRRRWRFSI
jgi:hypothetical protein